MRARNMQALTDASRRRHPGVVIYGVGDEEHRLRISDHNEDDTAGVRAAQSDPDSNPEHRAIDLMLGAAFTKAQAYALIADLLADPGARARLFYIIFDGWIWSRSNNWVKRQLDGDDDQHTDHVHISGWAADDENGAGWPAVDGGGDVFCRRGDKNENVRRLQLGLARLEPGSVAADADYGSGTAAAVKRLLGGTGEEFNPELSLRLEEKLAVRAVKLAGLGAPGRDGLNGKDGTDGRDGVDGRDGKDAVIAPGTRLVVESMIPPDTNTMVESGV